MCFNAGVVERIRHRIDSELPLLASDLRTWVTAHLTTPGEITASLDPDGTQLVAVWLVTDHTGADDSSSRLVYEPDADAFGIAIDMPSVGFQNLGTPF
jgi:hypothetical protein